MPLQVHDESINDAFFDERGREQEIDGRNRKDFNHDYVMLPSFYENVVNGHKEIQYRPTHNKYEQRAYHHGERAHSAETFQRATLNEYPCRLFYSFASPTRIYNASKSYRTDVTGTGERTKSNFQ